ncbi:hypothetical protein NGA_0679600, partial [Nannochloropsis gaditana CCMP526]
MTPDA